MGRPLDATERAQVARFLEHPGATRCPRTRAGLSARERLDALRDAIDIWAAGRRAALEEQRRQRAATPRPPSPEVVKWHKLYQEAGLSLEALGLMVGRHATTLHETFRRHGLATRPRRGAAQLDQAA